MTIPFNTTRRRTILCRLGQHQWTRHPVAGGQRVFCPHCLAGLDGTDRSQEPVDG